MALIRLFKPASEQPKPPTNPKARLTLLIAAATAVVAPVTMKWEGKENIAYLDRMPTTPVATVCYGYTGKEVKVGDYYSDAKCKALLESAMRSHAEGVAKCTPGIIENRYVFGAAIDTAYNIGVARYCASSIAKHFNAGRLAEGCNFMNRYVYAGGKKYRGLVNRRADISAICLKGL